MLSPPSVDDAEKGVVDQERTYPGPVALRFVHPAPSHNTMQPLYSPPAPHIGVKLKKPRPMPRATAAEPLEIALQIRRLAPSHNATQALSSMPAPQLTVKLKKPRPVHRVTLKEVSTHLPPPRKQMQKRASQWIRFQLWFNTYRKFFLFVMALNLVGIALAIFNIWTYPRRYTGAFVLGNLLVAILMRNELFGRFLYLLVNTLFAKWTPLSFRLGCTSVLQHLGGIHSGCATSGFLWLIFRVATLLIHNRNNYDVLLVTGVLTNVIIGITIASAFPWVRNNHHNVFERHHRFMGWLGLLSTWAFVVLGDNYDLETRTWNPDSLHILKQQDFWFASGMTIFVVIPWFTIREVKVDIEIPSPKVAIIRFERGMQQGLLGRISRGPIMEYHAFGIVSEGVHAKEHYLICGVQGDFTRSLVDNPPTHLWTRQLKFAGVSNSSTLYKRGIRVCTGTGLGAALSTCLQSPDWYLIWIGSKKRPLGQRYQVSSKGTWDQSESLCGTPEREAGDQTR